MINHAWIWIGTDRDDVECYRCDRDDCREYVRDGEPETPCKGGPAGGDEHPQRRGFSVEMIRAHNIGRLDGLPVSE